MRTIELEPRVWVLRLADENVSRERIRFLFHSFRHDTHVRRVEILDSAHGCHMVIQFAMEYAGPHNIDLRGLDLIHAVARRPIGLSTFVAPGAAEPRTWVERLLDADEPTGV